METIASDIISNGAIGGGAILGAMIIIKFMATSLTDLQNKIKEMSDKLDLVINNQAVTAVKTEVEITHLREKLLEVERRLTRLEEQRT